MISVHRALRSGLSQNSQSKVRKDKGERRMAHKVKFLRDMLFDEAILSLTCNMGEGEV